MVPIKVCTSSKALLFSDGILEAGPDLAFYFYHRQPHAEADGHAVAATLAVHDITSSTGCPNVPVALTPGGALISGPTALYHLGCSEAAIKIPPARQAACDYLGIFVSLSIWLFISLLKSRE